MYMRTCRRFSELAELTPGTAPSISAFAFLRFPTDQRSAPATLNLESQAFVARSHVLCSAYILQAYKRVCQTLHATAEIS